MRARWHARLQWPEKSGQHCLLRLDAGSSNPWLGRLDKPVPGNDRDFSGTLLTLLEARPEEICPNPSRIEWRSTPDTFASRRDAVLDHGLEIDDNHWAALNRLADRDLVESSDISRRGAGE